jgi:hypothetical protein
LEEGKIMRIFKELILHFLLVAFVAWIIGFFMILAQAHACSLCWDLIYKYNIVEGEYIMSFEPVVFGGGCPNGNAWLEWPEVKEKPTGDWSRTAHMLFEYICLPGDGYTEAIIIEEVPLDEEDIENPNFEPVIFMLCIDDRMMPFPCDEVPYYLHLKEVGGEE